MEENNGGALSVMASSKLQALIGMALCLQIYLSDAFGATRTFNWVIQQTNITRLCKTTEVVTVNGKSPGPSVRVREGDFVVVNVINTGKYNATLHWHGVRQLGSPWHDGAEYITQCPIQPGSNFTYRFRVSDQRGTLWWHGHYGWLRATVYGALIILPKKGLDHPYPEPGREKTLIIGEWWNEDPMKVGLQSLYSSHGPLVSDALIINGDPGNYAPCSYAGTIIKVKKGESILLRIINTSIVYSIFLAIAEHNMTVVAMDARYTKPYNTDVMAVATGQTIDVLVTANQGTCGQSFYLATHIYWTRTRKPNNKTSTAVLRYTCPGVAENLTNSPPDKLPSLPSVGNTTAVEKFVSEIRSLNSESYPTDVPKGKIDENLYYVAHGGMLPCRAYSTCKRPGRRYLVTAMNNISFALPSISILEAHYYNIPGVFGDDYPDFPPFLFDFSDPDVKVWQVDLATKLKTLKYNSTVQLVLQSSKVLKGSTHEFHLHGHDFYVVGRGLDNYDPNKHPKTFNLVDPPVHNTFFIQKGWVAIRFVADNPGAWFFHCHVDYHMQKGMGMVFLTLERDHPKAKLPKPPIDLPMCLQSPTKLLATKTHSTKWSQEI